MTADSRRLARAGYPPLTVEQGLALFDAALTSDRAALVPVNLDLSVLRSRAATEGVPPLLRSLVRVARRRIARGDAGLVGNLGGLKAEDRVRVVLDQVRGQVAAVLGHTSGDAVQPRQSFTDLGFDSLTA
ncbi:acyl carrier protein, partial [Actinoalloteichus caeruleus]